MVSVYFAEGWPLSCPSRCTSCMKPYSAGAPSPPPFLSWCRDLSPSGSCMNKVGGQLPGMLRGIRKWAAFVPFPLVLDSNATHTVLTFFHSRAVWSAYDTLGYNTADDRLFPQGQRHPLDPGVCPFTGQLLPFPSTHRLGSPASSP